MRLIPLAQLALRDILCPGDNVLDATAGNGHDSLFLAQCVGKTGCIYAFDIQIEAINATRERLRTAGLKDCLRLHHCSHAELAKHIDKPLRAAMFNLGYLPGSDHQTRTQSESSIGAIRAALNLLLPKGRLSLMAYPGHEGGKEEYERIEQFLQELTLKQYTVSSTKCHNGAAQAPVLFIVEAK